MSQPNPASWNPDSESEQDWKQEVNRRLAAHKSRRGLSTMEPPASADNLLNNGSRASQAAARVAARYAAAPSYSEMQAAEARVAVRTAEIATQVALEAQAKAEAVLANMDAATVKPENRENRPSSSPKLEPFLKSTSSPIETIASLLADQTMPLANDTVKKTDAVKIEATKDQVLGIRWEPDMPVRKADPPVAPTAHRNDRFEIPLKDWWEPAPQVDESLAATALQQVEPAQPIFANLIEFPRELVATRKARPRLAEGPLASSGTASGQLSIFEVDPGAISVEPETADAIVEPVAPVWSGMKLDAQPALETKAEAEEEAAQKASTIVLASVSRRLLAAVVDGTLIAGTFLIAATAIASHMTQLPTLKQAETGAAAAFLFTAVVYLVLFSALAQSTPGMKYAGISLCTFDEEFPTCAQRCQRLGALLLSLLPMGLGIVWGLFDEEHLSWHDRLSRTYQRKS